MSQDILTFLSTALERLPFALSLQFGFLFLQLFFLTVLFELIPFIFKRNGTFQIKDFFNFQVLRGAYTASLIIFLLFVFLYFQIPLGFISLEHLPFLVQGIIIYLIIDAIIYFCHLSAHKYRIPFISKAHKFHHSVTHDMDWTNARKEHYLILTLFTMIFFIVLFMVFQTTVAVRLFVISAYLTLLSFSHFRIPVSVPYLDKFFLFPKDHLRHHTERSGPYGTSLSIFDTIFKTRK